ncbi:MAG: hypothetical protein ACKO5K_11625, partial [Armatimonadota bacterium]
KATWFDPRSGRTPGIGTIRPTAGRWVIPKTPTPEDWVLRLDAVGGARMDAVPSRWAAVRAERDRDRSRNVAALADVRCSSNDDAHKIYAARHAVDGNADPSVWIHWSSDPARETPSREGPTWLSLEWSKPVDIAEVRLTFKSEYEVSSYALEADGRVVAEVETNRESRREHPFSPPLRVRKLRFLGRRGPDVQPEIVRVVEIEALAPRRGR